jgi:hypothetical protein
MYAGDYEELSHEREMAKIRGMPAADYRLLQRRDMEWHAALVEVQGAALAAHVAQQKRREKALG